MIRLINTTTRLPIDKGIEASFFNILEKDFKNAIKERIKACPEWSLTGYVDVQFVSLIDLDHERNRPKRIKEEEELQNKFKVKPEVKHIKEKQKEHEETVDYNIPDMLGIYIPHHSDSHRRCIKVCPELVMAVCEKLKTKKEIEINLSLEDLYPTILLAVVIHQLAHSLMDKNISENCCTSVHWLTHIRDDGGLIRSNGKESNIRKRPVRFISSPYCEFRGDGNGNTEISPILQEWRSIIEESLANAFVLNQNFKEAQLDAIKTYIALQPFAYKAGLQWNSKFQDLLGTANSWSKFKAKCFRSNWDSKFSQKGAKFPLEVIEARLKNEEKIDSFDFESELDQYIKDHQHQWQKEFEVDQKMNLIVLNDDLQDGELVYSGKEIDGFFDCTFCKNLKSLTGAPKKVTGDVDCNHCCNLTSLEGIGNDYLNEIGGNFIISSSVKSNILGLLKVKELKHVLYAADASNELKLAVEIINEYLLCDDPNDDSNLVRCKDDLIEEGLKDYAKL